MSSLDRADCDRMGPDGRIIEGTGGVDAGTMSILSVVPCVLSEAAWLTPDQQVRLLAVACVVSGIVWLLADDPGTEILHSMVARMCTTLDHCGATLGHRGR
ncbi:hypothetical protein [Streptomyces luridiscabiei]|uniref:hypothetical protein n=1 Tax=Streptomyces luridiscabiei TaxID=164114 RepID=UPI001F38A516|nr:hypothetical protein [Streptomyces luridiscabiei]